MHEKATATIAYSDLSQKFSSASSIMGSTTNTGYMSNSFPSLAPSSTASHALGFNHTIAHGMVGNSRVAYDSANMANASGLVGAGEQPQSMYSGVRTLPSRNPPTTSVNPGSGLTQKKTSIVPHLSKETTMPSSSTNHAQGDVGNGGRNGGNNAVGRSDMVDNDGRRSEQRSSKGKQREPPTAHVGLPPQGPVGAWPDERRANSTVGGPRVKGACEACKQAKVRCDLTQLAAAGRLLDPPMTCRRCILNNIQCRIPSKKPKRPPPSHNELEQRVHEQNMRIMELLLGVSASQPVTATNPIYSPNSNSGLSYPRLVDEVLTLPVWDKNLPKEEQEEKLDECVELIRHRLQKIQMGLDLTAGNHSSPLSGSVGGNHRDDMSGSGGDAKPRWLLEYEEEASEEFDEDEGDKVWGGRIASEDDCRAFMRRGGYAPEEEGRARRRRLPAILEKGIVTMEICRELFELFFQKINMFFSPCDPVLHTADNVLHSSSFLFTTMCAVASRHYTKYPNLYPILLEAARQAAARAVNGPKTVETVQAFMLLGVYSPPSRTFAEDRNYLYVGLAVRIGADLQLHRKEYVYPPREDMPELEARALLNRARAWINCFCTDLSISTQTGRPVAIVFTSTTAGGAKPIPFDTKTWWRCSKFNLGQDLHMCAYANLLEVMSDFHAMVFSGISEESEEAETKQYDRVKEIQRFADKITAVKQEWLETLYKYFPKRDNQAMEWRDNLWPFLCAYAQLVVVSIGLRDAMRLGMKEDNPFSEPCFQAAAGVLKQVLDKMAPLGCMRYCPEAYFVFMGFAAAFLLKMLRPKFSFMMRPGLEKTIIELVQRLIALLDSDEVAIDNRHTPKLYARFLTGLVDDHLQGRTGARTNSLASQQQYPSSLNRGPVQVQVTQVDTESINYPRPQAHPSTSLYPLHSGFSAPAATKEPQAHSSWSTPGHAASGAHLTQPQHTYQQPNSQFPSPAYGQAHLPYTNISPSPMDVDPYTLFTPMAAEDVADIGYVYHQPLQAAHSQDTMHVSMTAINDNFWNEPVMPGYWGMAHQATWPVPTTHNGFGEQDPPPGLGDSPQVTMDRRSEQALYP